MKSGFVDKLIENVDRVEPGDVQNYLIRLAHEKGIFEKVFAAMQEGVVVADIEGRVRYINGGACRLFGVKADDVTGARITDKIRGLDWEALVGGERKVVSRDMEIFYPQNRYVNFYLAPLSEDGSDGGEMADPDAPAYVMLVRDITQTRKVAEEKIESERLNALTMLAAGVAHEIGNPLNSLGIHLQLLEKKLRIHAPDLYEAGLKELIDISSGEVKRLDFIVDQFLGAIRPSFPKLDPQDVNSLITESVRFLQPELDDLAIAVKLELRSDLPVLQLDGDQIKQAFYNLIKNAIQSMGNGGKLLIRSDISDEHVLVKVVDDGRGISPSGMASLFEPSVTTKVSGSGLGLLIVRRIVREHGGEIEFESEEGEGTAVTVFLPRVQKGMRLLEG